MAINEKTLLNSGNYAEQFRDAKPFRHAVIEDFFSAAVAELLDNQFPVFEIGNARTESGDLGNKSAVERIRKIGPAYASLDRTIRSREFLYSIGRITGIDKLIYDPWYFGGGTHCNRAGQELDPHIDFNRHPIRHRHRRLNLIVYLNHEWQDDWGGSLELHSDPYAKNGEVTLVTPLYNRCIIFETTGNSWHGFSLIQPPAGKLDILRRSIALYFYSEDRAVDESVDTHSTIYVDRPLPEHMIAGHTLSEADLQDIHALLARRDQHNQRLYRDLTQLQTTLEKARLALSGGLLGRIKYFLEKIRVRLGR